MITYNPYSAATKILMESGDGKEYFEIKTILEDAASPITTSYREKLFQSVIDKGHIDFGSIPLSKGDIKSYSGYTNMIDTLDVIISIGTEEKSNVVGYANTVLEAIKNIEALSSVFQKGFTAKNEYVMLEYNTYVFTCVEATSTLIYEFVDFIKRPDKPTYVITLKDTKFRANTFYFEQLTAFNNVNKNMYTNYRKMLEAMISSGRNNFTGAEIIGIAAVSIAALAIVPITRALIYHLYNLRSSISSELDLQAAFLEMNKSCIEANDAFTEDKKKKIISKQEGIRKFMLSLSDKIRIKEAKSAKVTGKEIEQDNKAMSVNSIRKDISDSPLSIL